MLFEESSLTGKTNITKHRVIECDDIQIFGKRLKFDHTTNDFDKVTAYAEQFFKVCSTENKDCKVYYVTLSHGQNVKDIDYFIGAEGIKKQELSEFTLKKSKYISIKYKGDYKYSDSGVVDVMYTIFTE